MFLSTPHQEKQAIEKCFSRAAHTYDKAATLQRDVGYHLYQRIHRLFPEQDILDLGCGTGYFTKYLATDAQAVGVDISRNMLEQAHKRCHLATYIQADAENLPFQKNSFDCVYSNLVLQWCDYLSRPLHEVERIIKPKGRLFFSTLTNHSLEELSAAWHVVDGKKHVNQFLTLTDIEKSITSLKRVQRYELHSQKFTMYYPTIIELLRSLKDIGASHLRQERRKHFYTKQNLRDLFQAYESFKNDQNMYPLTYYVCFGEIYFD